MSAFDRFRDRYGTFSASVVRSRWMVVGAYLTATALLIVALSPFVGLEIFPRVDSGRFQLRLKAPTGTRIEVTERLVKDALRAVKEEAGGEAVAISVGYVGLVPSSYPINAIHLWTGGPEEAVLRVALHEGSGVNIESLKRRLRDRFHMTSPEVQFSFEPADIVSDVMSFGSPTPVEVIVSGPNYAESRSHAAKVRAELAKESSLRDLRYGQSLDYPTVNVRINRELAGLSGLTVEQVARSLVTATSSSRFVVPNYWPDPKSGIGYQVQVEIPYQVLDSVADIETLPVDPTGAKSLLLRDVAEVTRGTMPGEYDRYNMKRTVTLTANVVGADLGTAAREVARAIARAGAPPKGVLVDVRGQLAPLREIVDGLTLGLGMSIVAIALLLTANFQSIRLAIVAVATTPAVIAGVGLALIITRTTLNLQSFMGAIMAMGVAVANAILLVTFAERARLAGASASEAAVRGARDRLRPILMTSLAMIAGMLPMALGVGEGGEQSAPLGRAVVGGLAASTLSTLLVLPSVFALIQGGTGRVSASLDPFDIESENYVGRPAEEGEPIVKEGYVSS